MKPRIAFNHMKLQSNFTTEQVKEVLIKKQKLHFNDICLHGAFKSNS